MGGIFMLASTLTKKQMVLLGASKTIAALGGGLVGGVSQSIVMTPAAMVFTSLNLNRGKKGYEHDNALTVAQRIIKEKGIGGTYWRWHGVDR
jgi:formiminotetrahydrofolate cyclodeaminase